MSVVGNRPSWGCGRVTSPNTDGALISPVDNFMYKYEWIRKRHLNFSERREFG